MTFVIGRSVRDKIGNVKFTSNSRFVSDQVMLPSYFKETLDFITI